MTLPRQTPEPGTRRVLHQGDTLEFSLSLASPREGTAWLRTNLGHAETRRREIIRHVEAGEAVLARDWHDVPMRRTGPARFAVTLAMTEVGVFAAKAFFLPSGHGEPMWPEGPNAGLKIEPAEYCCANGIYTAFVRQFGGPHGGAPAEREAEDVARLERAGYVVIPRSGTFRALIRRLDFIVGSLRCRILQLLPVHPTPTTFGRMGRFGSPFAVLDHMDVDPALAEFDRRATPMDQFRELVDAAHRREARLFLDLPINQTGWASRLQEQHPGWFSRGEDRTFRSPGAWGVTWEDLLQLDYGNRDLWRYMADVFLYWCRQGVDGFRCDAGYMVPFAVWEYIVARVRREFPDTVFLLEGLGGRAETVERLIGEAGLDWAYSELFQSEDRVQVEACLAASERTSEAHGILVHFAETHDNNRLAARSPRYARMRTALAALCSRQGAFGITCGVEWFAAERIDVHGAASLNWGSLENQVDPIARLHAILESQSVFHPEARLRPVQDGPGNVVALVRENPATAERALIAVNLDCERPGRAFWPRDAAGGGGERWHDLLSGRDVALEWREGRLSGHLEPAEVLCLSPDPAAAEAVEAALRRGVSLPARVRQQRLRAKAIEVWCRTRRTPDLDGLDLAQEARALSADPMASVKPGPESALRPVVRWRWPVDTRRTVLVPPGFFLCVGSPHRFSCEIRAPGVVLARENSLPRDDGTHFALLAPLPESDGARRLSLAMTVFEPERVHKAESPLLCLGDIARVRVRTDVDAAEVRARGLYALCTNGRGAMAQVRGAWGELRSVYDALLAGNPDARYPVDRRVMLVRLRVWLVHRAYSQDINIDCQTGFWTDQAARAGWRFDIPTGLGKRIGMDVELALTEGANAVRLTFRRAACKGAGDTLADEQPVRLILRPDVDDRLNHGATKAYRGPEWAWRGAVQPQSDGFLFGPSPDYRLRMRAPGGVFALGPEWTYNVSFPEEAERGLESLSDLFSPGYFAIELKGGESASVDARIEGAGDGGGHEAGQGSGGAALPRAALHPLADALLAAMRQFVVRRGDARTVIAGYPWFLDWGRDTLICLRGMIAAGWRREVREILVEFARFESRGTLPNMIRGADSSNRETSDAPLWFLVAVADFLRGEPTDRLLQADCGGRTLADVVASVARHYRDGTPNGIRMDPASGLVYSPPHFTWMDTNYPAATPRAGYPVEIQALWHAGLVLAARIEPTGPWDDLAGRVRESIRRYYVRDADGYLADCLHAAPNQGAAEAAPDDALRPNQLLAITLGALADRELAARAIDACEELLVPGAIRSLADRPARFAAPVEHGGRLLNEPARPYWGRYEGDEDTRRKPAYHNGTAWTWLFPSYAEALCLTYGSTATRTAMALLGSAAELMNEGCAGQSPEIVDGDSPHRLRGCGAQAWGVSECYRVLDLLGKMC